MTKDCTASPLQPTRNIVRERGPMNCAICIFEDLAAARRRHVRRLAALPLLTAALLVPGCTSSSSRPEVGSITHTEADGSIFKDANGNPQPTLASLIVGQGAYMDVTITNDTALLGANWSVTCQSALPPGTPLPPGQTEDTSCGVFSPLHTMSGPVPSYATSGAGYVTFYIPPAAAPKGGAVTLYATSTADPSRYSSVTLTINPPQGQ